MRQLSVRQSMLTTLILAALVMMSSPLGVLAQPGPAVQLPNAAQYRGNAAHTGEQPGPAPFGAPTVRWSFQTGGKVRSSPVVADGVLYVGSADWHVYAIDLETGEEVWRFLTGGPVMTALAVSDGRVFAPSFDGTLYALDAVNGEPLWRTPAGSASAPTIVDGIVLVSMGNAQSGMIRAFDAETGIERWHQPGGSGSANNSPSVLGRNVYLATPGGVRAFDSETGLARWTDRAQVNLGDDESQTGQLSGTDAMTEGGASQAFVASEETVFASAAISGGLIYFVRGAALIAADAETGSVRWSQALDEVVSLSGNQGAPAISNGTVYVGTAQGSLYAFDSITGRQLWGNRVAGSVQSSPAVVDGQVIFGSYDQHVYGFDGETGEQLWSVPLDGAVQSSPAVIDGLVVVGSDDGRIYALGEL